LSVDTIALGTSTDLTITLRANLERRMPEWADYKSASAAAQREWNHMFRKLTDHEDRHVEIAVEEADKLAADLVGHDISDIAKMVTAANKRMADRQKALDDATDHGARPGAQYGDVSLDVTVI
jgi:predicted secreted Zn-dependent protease